MNIMDTLLEKFNLSYDDLNSAERDTLYVMMDSLKKSELTVSKIKEYISSMKDSVEAEMTTTENNSKKDIFLKARLRNYMLLEAFLSSPEKAQRAIEASLSGIASKSANH